MWSVLPTIVFDPHWTVMTSAKCRHLHADYAKPFVFYILFVLYPVNVIFYPLYKLQNRMQQYKTIAAV